MPRRPRRKNFVEEKMVRQLDDLAKFEEFKTLLPKLQRMIKEGKSSKDIRDWAAPFVQASMTNIALTEKDAKTRLAAGKDLLDRDEGKAKENKEITHRLDNLDDRQLDALLKSEIDAYEESPDDEEAKH